MVVFFCCPCQVSHWCRRSCSLCCAVSLPCLCFLLLNAAAVGQRFGQVWADYLGFEVAQGVDANWYRIEALIREIDKLDLGTTNLGIEYNVYRKRIDNWVKEENLIKLIVGFSIERFPHLWVDDVVSRVRGAL